MFIRSLILVCALVWLPRVVSAAPRPLNVVFILADDLGVMDVGCYNAQTFYETPNIDALAKSGVRFTQGYAACPVCSPTRGSILTGKYPPRFGVTDYIGANRPGKLTPAATAHHLPGDEDTIAARLKRAGYATFFAGKWHLGDGEFSPNHFGFGPVEGKNQFYYPPSTQPLPNPRDDPKTTDRIADAAVKFIGEHKDEPFFAYLPFLAVHIPVGAKPELIRKYEKKREELLTATRKEVWGRERDSAVRLTQARADYAAMLEQLDGAIGRVLGALDANRLRENTIVVFLSDNGGLSTAEGNPTSNLPYRGGKGWPYEGGVLEPWIMRVPGVAAGATCDTPVITTDFYPTFLELCGLPPAPEQHRDGVSLVPLLKGGTIPSRPLFWHYPHYGNQGGAPFGMIRDGDLKLVEWYEDGALELYDVRIDAAEKHDLARGQPEKARELAGRLAEWRKSVGAKMPTPNPDGDRDAAAFKANMVRQADRVRGPSTAK